MNAASESPMGQAYAQQRDLINLLQAISLATAEAPTNEDAFRQVLAFICDYMDWPLGHVYNWSEATETLVSSGIWYMANEQQFSAFRELSERTAFEPGQGTVGRVLTTGEAVMVPDVRHDTGFVRQLPIEQGGIRAYFSFPVVTPDQVAAVMEFFSPTVGAPGAEMAEIINHAGALLGMSIVRKKAVEQLLRSQTQLAEAQRTAHVAHWEWDIARDQVNCSPEMYRILGISKGEFEPSFEGFLRYVHPRDKESVQRKMHAAHTGGDRFDHFHRIVRPDGAERIVHTRGRPVYDQASQIVKLSGTSQDMTELKATELQLAQRVRQLTTLGEIGQTVASTLNLGTIYEHVLGLLRPLLGAEALVLLLHDDDALEIVAHDQIDIADTIGVRVPIEGSIVGEVWRTTESLHLHGEQCRQRITPTIREATGYHPSAIIAAPLCVHDDCLGVLAAAHRDADAFDAETLRVLEAAALWTAIAIDNARKYEALQRRLDETDVLVNISNALIEVLDLEKVLQLIVHNIMKVIEHADWIAIHLLSSDKKWLELAASAGLQIGARDYSISSGEGIAGQVMAHGETINISDLQADPRRLPVDESIHARALLVAPVESRRQRLGTISVQCATPSTFTAEDERLLRMLGIQAGIAIDNARLYTVQQRARQRAEHQGQRIRQMARRMVQAQEDERARISRELHDEAGQSLTALQIGLELAQAQLPDELAEARSSLQELAELTSATMSNLRRISHNLRPPGLDAYGLDAALRGLCEDFAKHTKLAVSYEGAEASSLRPLPALSLYRFAQEALTNVAKHADASSVHVELVPGSDTITLWIEDDGQGFAPLDWEASALPAGVGLIGMLERLEMVDGRLDITSTEGTGTRLTAVVPLKPEE